ncbi:hypothetical protein M409DRAFT_54099 [Zasmidium cellare ATCC 36951]|uniref:Uncharacterized protein n=1 Tax=Zasmidium cellare ATCC 36951 TaxID=1080233 RepID=A0A6A6CMW8_ZASCE|nr:uncharacterized protein M409DRAFT_54099 [Zasmidium cellare ATCC 36951]KAF2167500.1 hypothetical protein M409DRAFT_54099 [Zasmidium cellare ATCC 36951]
MSTMLQPPALNLGLLQPLPEVSWEKTLNRNFLMAKNTLRTGDASFFKNTRATLFASGIDWPGVVKLHLPADVAAALDTPKLEDIHKLNKAFILDVEDRAKTIKQKIEASIRAGKTEEELEAEIDSSIDEGKEQVNKKLEDLRGELKVIIRKIPSPVAKQAAVNVWLESWVTIQDAVGRIMEAFNDIVNAVAKLVKQVWAVVQKAWKTVETVVKDVVDWIESLFD